jgi:hypothetical protein
MKYLRPYATLAILACACLFAGCNFTTEGEIVNKIYVPGHMQTGYYPVTLYGGYTYMQPYQYWVPDSYTLWIASPRSDSKQPVVARLALLSIDGKTYGKAEKGHWFVYTFDAQISQELHAGSQTVSPYAAAWRMRIDDNVGLNLMTNRTALVAGRRGTPSDTPGATAEEQKIEKPTYDTK